METTANGILVVNAISGATTASGAFTLDNPELRAGAFDYRLFQGGLNGSDPNDWFLRSSFITGPGPVEPIGPSPPPTPSPPGTGRLRTGACHDGVVQPIARQMGLQTLGTMHQRIGDTLTLADTGGEGAGVARSDWARFFGKGSTIATTRLEFAGGVTAKLGPGVSLYAQAGYQFALDNAYIRNGIQGDIGLRYVW